MSAFVVGYFRVSPVAWRKVSPENITKSWEGSGKANTTLQSLEGDIEGYLIPCQKSTNYRYRIHDWSRLLKVVSISRICLSQAIIPQQSTSAIARKR